MGIEMVLAVALFISVLLNASMMSLLPFLFWRLFHLDSRTEKLDEVLDGIAKKVGY